jgi:biotin synthase
MNPRIAEIGRHVLAGGDVDRSQAETLAAASGPDRYDLFYWANRVRMARCGPRVSFCSIVPLTLGGCSEDCAFCAQSVHHHTNLTRPSTCTDPQIIAAAEQAAVRGAESFGLVSSGRRPSAQLFERLLALVETLRRRSGIGLCASLGALTHEQAMAVAQAGVQRYNHNLETSAAHFPNIVTTHTYRERLQTLEVLSQTPLSICSGGIFGLGESWADRLDLAFALRRFRPAVVPLNFLHPIPGTPLEHAPPVPPLEILQIIAVFRFVFPAAQIKVAGGRERNLRDLQSWMFFAGASAALLGNYLTTTGRPPDVDWRMVGDLELEATPMQRLVPASAECGAGAQPPAGERAGQPTAAQHVPRS